MSEPYNGNTYWPPTVTRNGQHTASHLFYGSSPQVRGHPQAKHENCNTFAMLLLPIKDRCMLTVPYKVCYFDSQSVQNFTFNNLELLSIVMNVPSKSTAKLPELNISIMM